ncbi:hypothetical protein [Sinomonas halotolerans]|uniref:Uncharacterized protein n=1 Tax=Sinomonas halotolerans TaxID=1644133 RepID=A0ABU9WXV7_9MICC
MAPFKKRTESDAEEAARAAAHDAELKAAGKPAKREVHAFRQIPPYPMDEELARRIAMRAYGDADNDGEPDIPAAQFPG